MIRDNCITIEVLSCEGNPYIRKVERIESDKVKKQKIKAG